MSTTITKWIAYSTLIFLGIMLVAAIYNMRSGGSLDDLPGDVIKKIVDGTKEGTA